MRLTFVLLAVLVPISAWAHQSSGTNSRVRVEDDGRVLYTLDLSLGDLAEPLGLPADSRPTELDVTIGSPRLLRYVRERIAVVRLGEAGEADEEPCAWTDDESVNVVRLSGELFAQAQLVARCEPPLAGIRISYDLFFDLDARHEGRVVVERGGRSAPFPSFTKGHRAIDVDVELHGAKTLPHFLWQGVLHIFLGYDHIAFLIGLLLVAVITFRKEWASRGLREGLPYVVKVVSAFTVGHTITLILAALETVVISSQVVESAIAASILYVAVENIVLREPRYRWPLALLFGLIHGMGFASVLRPHLPKDNYIVPLLVLNLGVELGQLAIVLVVLPLLVLAARTGAAGYRRIAVVGGSTVLGAFAALWLLERVMELELFGGILG